MKTVNTRALDRVDRSMIRLVGGKAASLGEMLQAGLPVPTGFVVTTTAYRTSNNTISEALESELIERYDALGHELVAVRSSAVAEDSLGTSWAGQLDSYLNVGRNELVEAVRNCWQSIHSKHAQEYAQEHRVSESERAIAVIVQAMVKSDSAGVLFTTNPVNERRDEIMIEAVYGLGETLVQGAATPDNYILNRDGQIVAQTLHRQKTKLLYASGKNTRYPLTARERSSQILTPTQLEQLAELAMKIEEHYGSPQDIEWAIEENTLYIVQSRPITTLAATTGSKRLYDLRFTRDITLAFVQESLVAETKYFARILGLKKTATPDHIIAHGHDGYVEQYMRLVEENDELAPQLSRILLEDSHFLTRLEESMSKDIKALEQLVARQKLTIKDYVTLDELSSQVWASELIILMILWLEEPSLRPVVAEASLLRKKYDYVYEWLDTVHRQALQMLFPQAKGLHKYIGLYEALSGEPPSMNILKERAIGYWSLGSQIVTSVNAQDIERKFAVVLTRPIIPRGRLDGITGQTAHKGSITGVVSVVMSIEELSKVREGDILVSPMTTPAYSGAMRKAAAFVTDEGGVTCHAAIVARELRKPCIVGTNIATKVLNDGDEVEVDATNGSVRILRRSANKQNK